LILKDTTDNYMPRDLDNLDPTLLADLDSEADFAKSQQRRTFMPRITVERGSAVLVRFLPVEIGANRHWLGRFAGHWVHKRMIFCKTKTSPHLGGDPAYVCPICKLVENGMALKQAEPKKRAGECFAEPVWYGVVLKLAANGSKGRPEATKPPECYVPHEFKMYRSMFDQVRLIASRYAVKGTKGIVDIEKGLDIWVTRSARGYTFQPDSQVPIYEGDDTSTPQEIINSIWSQIILPDITIPDDAQITEYFHKIKEFIQTGGGAWESKSGRGGGGSGGGRGNQGHSNDDLQTDNIDGPPQTSFRGRGFQAPNMDASQSDLDVAALESGMESGTELNVEIAAPEVATRPTIPQTTVPVAAPIVEVAAPQVPVPVAAPVAAPQVQRTAAPPVAQAPAPQVQTSRATVPQTKLVPPPISRVTAPAPQPVTIPPQPSLEDDEEPPVESQDGVPPISESIEEPPAVSVAPPVQPVAPTVPAPTVQAPPAGAPPQVKAQGTKLSANLSSRLAAFQKK
jgi:hypothetical protein